MKCKIHFLFFFLPLLLILNEVQAQGIRVTGKVTRRSTGEALNAATVSVKGTKLATATDASGNFALTIPTASATLVVSYAGMTIREMAVQGAGEVNIALEENTSLLNDVVVVGYGQQRRTSVTGAISTVNTKELVQAPVVDLSNALQGRVPGVITKQASGEPGSDAAAIYIRGNSTFGATMQPLFVVDGIVRTYRDFSQMDPNEVESVSILKDASSAAMF